LGGVLRIPLFKEGGRKKGTLIKRGEFFITFPSPSQGEGEGGVIKGGSVKFRFFETLNKK